ncbi:MAG: hypothetical protein SNI49_08325 [Rikenellaceae bacterium]
MNKLFKCFFALLTLFSLTVSCSNEEEFVDLYVEDIEVTTVGYTSITCAGNIIGTLSESGVCYSTSPSPTTADSCVENQSSTSGKFSAVIEGLEAGTTYYIRVYAVVNGTTSYGAEKSVTTYDVGSNLITLLSVSSISYTSASVESYVLTTDSDVISRGICYSTTAYVTLESGFALVEDGSTGRMTQTIEGLTDGQEYFVCAYVETQSGITYSNEESFTTTLYNKPTTEILSFPEYDEDWIDVTYSVSRDNELEITESGVYYSESNDFATATKFVNSAASGEGEYTLRVTGLENSTLYYVWAYAKNIKGEGYSESSSASTLAPLGAVSISGFDTVLGYSANGTVEVTSLGIYDADVIDVGICWSKSSDSPTLSDDYISGGSIDLGDDITLDMRTLESSTTYYARPYITNEYGTSYGLVETFETRVDVYSNVIRTYSDGTSLPYTNAIKYAPSYVSDDVVSDFQKTLYENVETAVDDYGSGRIVEQLVLNFILDTNMEPLILLRLYYTNTAQTTTYQAYVYYRMSVAEDGVITVFDRMDYSGNTSTMYNSSNTTDESRVYLDALYDFLLEDEIILDWGNETVNTDTSSYAYDGVFRVYHKNAPEKNLRMSTYNFSYSSVTYVDPWW